MTYALAFILSGNLFIADHGLTKQDCQIEKAQMMQQSDLEFVCITPKQLVAMLTKQ